MPGRKTSSDYISSQHGAVLLAHDWLSTQSNTPGVKITKLVQVIPFTVMTRCKALDNEQRVSSQNPGQNLRWCMPGSCMPQMPNTRCMHTDAPSIVLR